MSTLHLIAAIVAYLGTALITGSTGYSVASLVAEVISARRRPYLAGGINPPMPPISVLKPLYGDEPRLYENLTGFCQQDYPAYQLVFGVRDPQDPAIAVVHKLREAYAHLTIDLVIDPRVHGTNLKISNLLNMLPLVRYPWLVLADSDISVPPDYLSKVTAPLANPDVGIVTCLYHGVSLGGFWSQMGCMFIDDWFAPSVRLSQAFGSTQFGFGSTIALRSEVLQAMGGLQKLRDTLADDYWLGELTRQAGLRTVLSDLVVGTDVNERGRSDLWTHELRWLRTIRSIAPLGFVLSVVCFTWPVALLGLALAPSAFNAVLVSVALAARVLRFFYSASRERRSTPWYRVLLTPFRDLMLLLEWAVALTGWQVKWRDQVLHADKNERTRHL